MAGLAPAIFFDERTSPSAQIGRFRRQHANEIGGRKLDLEPAPAAVAQESSAKAIVDCSTNTATRFFWPNGEMPPT